MIGYSPLEGVAIRLLDPPDGSATEARKPSRATGFSAGTKGLGPLAGIPPKPEPLKFEPAAGANGDVGAKAPVPKPVVGGPNAGGYPVPLLPIGVDWKVPA